MFRKAQTKLTIYYSLLFLLLFWTFSFGLYFWMDRSIGEGFISQVEQRQDLQGNDITGDKSKVVTIAGDVTMDKLRNTLILLNIGLLFVIPLASWFLAKKTLIPLQEGHAREQQFVSDASHEMRTPLAIITGEIEVMLHKKRTQEEYVKTLMSTKEESSRLTNLVESLLYLARDNNDTITFEDIDITDLINEVKNSLQAKSNNKNISINLTIDDSITTPIVSGNPMLLHQLFYNLLDNAITYSPNESTITFQLAETKHSIKIAIIDTGIGIASEHIPKLTRRFYRVDDSRSQTKGYGLGLSIVQSIIKKHKGKLLIFSNVNKGSTFTVVLPKA